jgi:hypothetical protein
MHDYTLLPFTQDIISLAHGTFDANKYTYCSTTYHRPFVAKAVVEHANTKAKGQPIFPNEA